MKTKVLVSACLLFSSFAPFQLSAQAGYDISRLDRFLEQTATRIPSGFEVMIVRDGQQVYWKAFGAWQRNQQAKIASATKWFSGALIMSLVDDGIISLDDRAAH